MQERPVSMPVAESPPAAAIAAGPATRSPGDTPFDDARSIQILSTEHWSLLATRSLVYRAATFVSAVTGSVVALALVAQASGFGSEFRWFAILVLAVDLLVGLGTLGRMGETDAADLRCVQGMNRIRHAYLEMVPGLRHYLVTSPYDDLAGVVVSSGALPTSGGLLVGLVHGLGTASAVVGLLVSVLVGAIAALLGLQAGLSSAVVIGLGVIGFLITIVTLAGIGQRSIVRLDESLEVRFPTPDQAP